MGGGGGGRGSGAKKEAPLTGKPAGGGGGVVICPGLCQTDVQIKVEPLDSVSVSASASLQRAPRRDVIINHSQPADLSTPQWSLRHTYETNNLLVFHGEQKSASLWFFFPSPFGR